MKPIELRIKGLNSFEEEQHIDFAGLMTAGIFGIFGPTGSGKSSIFDAMTMALYGQMPRHGGQNLKESVNLSATEMSVWFKFEIFNEIYVAQRSYALKKEKLEPKITRLYKIDGDTSLPITEKASQMTAAVTELIGLSYNDFSRSVVLPQGKFSEFLLLENKEKRNMLERIFNLEEYGESLSRLIAEKRRDTQGELKLTEARLERYEGSTPEKLQELTQESEKAAGGLTLMRTRREEFENTLKHLTEVKRVTTQQDEYLRRRRQEESEAAAQEKRKARLHPAMQAAGIIPVIKEHKAAYEKCTALEKSLAEKNAALAIAEQNEQQAAPRFEEAQSRKLSLYPNLITQEANLSQGLTLAVEHRTLNAQRNKLLNKYKKLQDALNNSHKEHHQLEQRQEELRQIFDSIAKERQGLANASRREQASKANALWKQHRDLEKQLAKKNTKLNALRKAVSNQQEEAASLAQALEAAAKIAEQAAADFKSAQTQSMAAVLAAELEQGEPCPVCGSVHHPGRGMESHDLQRLEALRDGKKNEADKLRLKAAELKARLDKDAAAEAELQADVTEQSKALQQQQTLLSEFAEALGSSDFDGLYTKILEQEQQRELLEAKERALRVEDEENRKSLVKAAESAKAQEMEMTAVKVTGTEKAGELARLTAQMERLGVSQGEDAEKLLAQVREQLAELDKTVELTKNALDKAREQKQSAARQRDEGQTRLAGAQEQASDLYGKLSDALQAGGFNNAEEAQAAWLSPEAAAALEKEIRAYENAAAETANALKRLDAELEVLSKNGELPQNPANALAEHQAALKTLNEEIEAGIANSQRLKDEVKKMTEGLAEAEKLSAAQKRLSHRADMLTDLSKLFAGNKFVEYVAKRQMEYITAEASRRLKQMSGGRYAIELSGADFVVRDDFNGGSRRSPKTLSGGETFMASLCLALALSSKIQLKRRSPLEFFFLDEGFGSLDSTLLDSVMSALEELRREKLTVGIISHVDELKNRIPKKLIVTPAEPGRGGSKVRVE